MKTPFAAVLLAAALTMPALAQNQSQNPPQPQASNQEGSSAQGQAQLSSSEIKSLQEALNKQGLSAGPADGILGPETKSALEKFQKEKGINPTGEPDQQTLAELGVGQGQAAQGQRSAKAGKPQGSPEQQQSQSQNQPENKNQPEQGGQGQPNTGGQQK